MLKISLLWMSHFLVIIFLSSYLVNCIDFKQEVSIKSKETNNLKNNNSFKNNKNHTLNKYSTRLDRQPPFHQLINLATFQGWIELISIFLAGCLASAAGIGGGSIFVAILIFIGNYHIHDAVPLSKAMIFSGAICAMVYNLKKEHLIHGGSVVDYRLVSLIVPGLLIGTSIGVLLNTIVQPVIILFALTCVLLLGTYRTTRQGISVYKTEHAENSINAFIEIDLYSIDQSIDKENTNNGSNNSYDAAREQRKISWWETATDTITSTHSTPQENRNNSKKPYFITNDNNMIRHQELNVFQALLKTFTQQPMQLLLACLVVTILCAVLFHKAIRAGYQGLAIVSTLVQLFYITVVQIGLIFITTKTRNRYESEKSEMQGETKIASSGNLTNIELPSIHSPTALQSKPLNENRYHTDVDLEYAVSYFSNDTEEIIFDTKNISSSLCSYRNVLLYISVAVFTGILSGLVGIGGGLLLSPFLLCMNKDPVVVISTTSVCVFFSSTSTTLQYFLLGRIWFPAALLLCSVTGIAGFLGVRLVYVVLSRYGKRSYVIFIVAIAVGTSCFLAVLKFVENLHHTTWGSIFSKEL